MSEQPKPSQRSVVLTRQAIIDTAIEIADRDGLNAVSMRAVGKQLGVEAMSLYHHVGNKDVILDGMVDAVFGLFYDPRPGANWEQEMRKRHESGREALRRHPWALGLMDSRRQPGQQTLEHHDAVIGCLRAAGFGLPLVGHAFALLDAHLYGHMLQELSLPFQGEEELADLANSILSELPEGCLPNFREFAINHAMAPGYDFGAEFEFGLQLVLEGLTARFAAQE